MTVNESQPYLNLTNILTVIDGYGTFPIADSRAGKLHYQSSYYYIGHLSRFIRPGAHRTASAKSCYNIESSAFLNNDGAVLVLNHSEQPIDFQLKIEGLQAKTTI